MTAKKGVSRVDAPKGRVRHTTESVKVGREVGVTVAVTDDPPQFLRISAWEERVVPDTMTAIKAARRRIKAELEEDIERDIRSYKKLINTIDPDDEEPEEDKPKRKKGKRNGSARERALRRVRG